MQVKKGGVLIRAEAPAIVIGQADGPPEYAFGNVAGGLLLPDGRVAIADGLASQVRIYDGRGEWGSSGSGPGSVGGPVSLCRVCSA